MIDNHLCEPLHYATQFTCAPMVGIEPTSRTFVGRLTAACLANRPHWNIWFRMLRCLITLSAVRESNPVRVALQATVWPSYSRRIRREGGHGSGK